MEHYPEELDFISLFQCSPIKKNDKDPFSQNESTFTFRQGNRTFKVIISPFYNRFILSVNDGEEEVLYYDFQSVTNIEIVRDTRKSAQIRLFLEDDRERFLTIVDVTFKPKFKVILREIFR
ncbi:hypothetical protein MKZ02_13525 [Pseudobacillus sp. FSL P4-0506]|uniref:hypothetical protein n=1 Tax=unclassified Pseudobacillus TaxID=2619284 RepID=UPI0030FBCC03